jgi:hypothetical protein
MANRKSQVELLLRRRQGKSRRFRTVQSGSPIRQSCSQLVEVQDRRDSRLISINVDSSRRSSPPTTAAGSGFTLACLFDNLMPNWFRARCSCLQHLNRFGVAANAACGFDQIPAAGSIA